MFEEWIEREEASAALTQVIDPRPDAKIDLALLHREFEAMGRFSEMPGESVNLMELVMNLFLDFRFCNFGNATDR